MAENIMEYVLNLSGNLSEKLQKIGINNEKQLDTWAKVQKQVHSANGTMEKMGKSIGSMNERISALRAQREWIPASNREAIRASNLEVKKLSREIEKLENLNGGKLKRWFGDLKTSIPAVKMLTNPLTMIAAGFYKVNQFVGQSEQVYKQQAVAETKLAAVMNNTIGASNDEISSIKQLADAQQKLGVVSSSVQMAGAQELATYVSKADTLEKLMPAMNDMLAQQYGINASQEQAAQIASMMGKVMSGEVGALKRYGYSFDEAQEKILKTGTEAEKAAVLFDVVTSAVGGVNEALANTPEGKLKQHANDAENLQARIGKLVTDIKAAILPIQKLFLKIGESVLNFFEYIKNNQHVFKMIALGFGIVGTAIGVYIAWQQKAVVWAAITKTWTAIITIFKSGEAAAWWATTVPMLITVGIIAAIIAAIVAVIATIIYCVKHVSGWGETWDNTMTFMKLGIELFKEKIALTWLKIKDTFISGFEIIETGWYKLQSLWDKDGAQSALAKIEDQRNERAKEIAEAQGKVDALKKQMSEMTVFALKTDGTTLSEFIGNTTKKIGINGQLQNAVNNDKNILDNKDTKATNEAIATGGTRNSTVNIKINDVVGSMVFQGGFSENESELERKLATLMARILGMAETQLA